MDTDTGEHSTRLLSMRARLGVLNYDELWAADWLLRKLEIGKVLHGPLNLDADPRDWIREFMCEVADSIWYGAFQSKRNGVAANPVEAGLRELREAVTWEQPRTVIGEVFVDGEGEG